MNSIRDIWHKVKWGLERVVAEWGLIIAIFLIAVSSFGLGRLSASEAARPAVSVFQAPEDTRIRALTLGGLVVASRNGSVYHYPWCGGASQIKEENKVWFPSEEAAAKAGYSPSKSCKGLTD